MCEIFYTVIQFNGWEDFVPNARVLSIILIIFCGHNTSHYCNEFNNGDLKISINAWNVKITTNIKWYQ